MIRVDPEYVDYTKKQLRGMKYVGGKIKMFSWEKCRFVDTRNFGVSMWISDMDKVRGPTTFKFVVNERELWKAVADGKDIVGFTLPPRVWDRGIYDNIYTMEITAENATTPDNHEFYTWAGIQDPHILCYS